MPWSSLVRLTDDDVLWGIYIIAIGTVSVSLGLFFGLSRSRYQPYRFARPVPTCLRFRCAWVVAATLAMYAVGLLFVSWLGTDALTSTRIELKQIAAESDSLEVGYFKRAQFLLFSSTFLLLFFSYHSCPGNKQCPRRLLLVLVVLMAVGLFLVVNPLNSPRWRILGFALSLALVAYPFRSSISRLALLAALFSSMIVIYPFMNLLGRTSNQWDKISAGQYADFFIAGDFDGFQSIINAIYYVEAHGHTLGMQLLGNIMAPIPRALYENKPLHSGELTGEAVSSINTNLAMPIYGELYLDFGFGGLFILGFLLGFAMAKAETLLRNQGIHRPFLYTTAIILSANMLFATRGALMAFTASLTYILLANYVVVRIAHARVHQPSNRTAP